MEKRRHVDVFTVARTALTISTLAALTAASYAVHVSILTTVALYGSFWRRRHPLPPPRRYFTN
jgi:hypothetical protein